MSVSARQIPLDLGYRPAHGRDDFLVSPSNRNAVVWIDRWPDWLAPALIIHGPAACGKTHLAAVWMDRAKAAVISMESLLRDQARAAAEQGRNIVIDPVDPWLGDRDAETALFHLYNLMREEGRSLLLTMRAVPARIAFSLPDLASRLRAAPTAEIAPPDDDLLAAILVKLFADRQLIVSQELVSYILPRMERSFAAARDLVAMADRLALAEKKPVSIPLIRKFFLMNTINTGVNS